LKAALREQKQLEHQNKHEQVLLQKTKTQTRRDLTKVEADIQKQKTERRHREGNLEAKRRGLLAEQEVVQGKVAELQKQMEHTGEQLQQLETLMCSMPTQQIVLERDQKLLRLQVHLDSQKAEIAKYNNVKLQFKQDKAEALELVHMQQAEQETVMVNVQETKDRNKAVKNRLKNKYGHLYQLFLNN